MDSELSNLLQTDRDFASMSKAKGAPEAYRQFIAVDATLLPNHNTPQFGRDNIVTFMNAGGAHYDLLWTPEAGRVSKSGDMGYTWGNYTQVIKNDRGDTIETESGKYLNVWIKIERVWKVAIDMGNMNPTKQ